MYVPSLERWSTPVFPLRRKETSVMLCLDFALEFRPMALIWQVLLLFLAVLLGSATTSDTHGNLHVYIIK
jgi:hypothetical protein